jgi:hypothetical protein
LLLKAVSADSIVPPQRLDAVGMRNAIQDDGRPVARGLPRLRGLLASFEKKVSKP